MKAIIIIMAITTGAELAPAQPMDAKEQLLELRLQALAAIETGGDDNAIGAVGEVSRYQITTNNWNRFSKLSTKHAANHDIAKAIAKKIIAEQVKAFVKRANRLPMDEEWYMLWHAPARLASKKLLNSDLDAMYRFANVVKLFKKGK